MKILFRPLFLGLFVFWVFFPFLSIIIWSVAAGWRFPDLLPEEYSMRGYEVSFDPDGDIVRGVITSTLIALVVGVIATAIGSAAGRASRPGAAADPGPGARSAGAGRQHP